MSQSYRNPSTETPVEFLRPPYQTRLVTINTEAFIAPLSIEPFEAALFSKTPKTLNPNSSGPAKTAKYHSQDSTQHPRSLVSLGQNLNPQSCFYHHC